MYFIYYKNNGKTCCETCHDGEKKMRQQVTKLEANGMEVSFVYTGLGQRVL